VPRTLIIVFVCLALFTGLLFWLYPEVNFTEDKQMSYVSLILISTYLLFALFQRRLNLSETFKYVLAWGAIGLVLMVGYVYRFELLDLKAKLTSSFYTVKETPSGEVTFPTSTDGHYYVNATVNGVTIRFMVDTGASRVVISPRDAKRLGFKTEDLSFSVQSSTANGMVWSAPVTLESITVQGHTVNNVQASISNSDLDVSLLGMSYLEKLKGYRVEKGTLTLQY
jgi:aspartyl protease family protein